MALGPFYSNDARKALVDALRALRVWEQQAEDLAYAEGDPRGEIPDAEMPQEYLDERERLRAEVSRYSALACGEPPDVTEACTDAYNSLSNPYHYGYVQLAVAILEIFP